MQQKPDLFRFKQFSVDHSRSSLKIGTDAVLLGAWINVGRAQTILDIGTGCGVIALMLAQRTNENVRIDAVEIEKYDAELATGNAAASPWKNKIRVFHTRIQDFTSSVEYDCIVSNPPFFSDSFHPPGRERKQARHTDSLPFKDLIDTAARLISSQGRLCIILPYQEGLKFINQASMCGFYLSRQLIFKSKSEKPAERLLLELQQEIQTPEVGELVMFDDKNEWTQAYKTLTKDFYLNL